MRIRIYQYARLYARICLLAMLKDGDPETDFVFFLFCAVTARYDEERRLFLGRQEMLNYLREKKRRALPSTSKRVSSIRLHLYLDSAHKVSCVSRLQNNLSKAFKPFSPSCTNTKYGEHPFNHFSPKLV